ncbi:MAG: anaerobic ribonucleoside-triphosphate reductase [Candidatus Margulisbacteria bacterium]|nr:anaerobic ribonucleoside-triphosphate reductase [Candidatus Margulisiibacteriota bacterium]MBU1616328.1 anaerobic ribonucleoside-triphosphate reductase [Candidatus Margulisiibacteriota bacterium]MBU1867180.1 anaerobic ribonucleoside-triphosphate reductase [Candidatus Margulisiibacteriota bacterium]
MTIEELSAFLENNQQIEWAYDDDGAICLRHTQYDGPNDKVRIEPRALAELTPQKLEQVLVGGRNVDQITRITGYFSKVSGWNKGKKGELVDRQRVAVS